MDSSRRSAWVYPSIGLFLSLSSAAFIIHAMFARALFAFQAPYFLGVALASACALGSTLQLARAPLRVLQRVPLGAWIPLVVLGSLFGGCLCSRCTSDALFDYEIRIVDRTMRPVLDKLSQRSDDVLSAVPSPAPSGLQIYQGASGYLVAVTGGSVNIDGSTLVYDSEEKRWRRIWGQSSDEAMERRKAVLQRVVPPTPAQ